MSERSRERSRGQERERECVCVCACECVCLCILSGSLSECARACARGALSAICFSHPSHFGRSSSHPPSPALFLPFAHTLLFDQQIRLLLALTVNSGKCFLSEDRVTFSSSRSCLFRNSTNDVSRNHQYPIIWCCRHRQIGARA